MTLRLLGLPEDDAKTVRFPYGSTPVVGSAPGFKRTDNVCFIYVLPDDDAYANQSHISYRNDGAERLTHIDRHTDAYRINFVFYGPDSMEWAKTVKAGIHRQDIMEPLLYQNQLALITTTPRITPARELKDGEWWTRHDLSMQFYHGVRIETENCTGTIEHVNIKTHTERST